MIIKPITPQEVEEKQIARIPPVVFAAFNKLITNNFSNGKAKVLQSELEFEIRKKLDRDSAFNTDWLNIEPFYRKSGWLVSYQKKCIGDDFESHFIFEKIRKRRPAPLPPSSSGR